MRLFNHFFNLSPSLLLSLLAVDANPLRPVPQLPFQIPPQASRTNNGKSWFSHVRNNIIQSIWPIYSDESLSKANGRGSTTSGPPPKLLARYGGDLVLRFEIKSAQEAEALHEAVNVLFLDVWEFTTEWVDIRLSKDVVCLRPFIPTQLVVDASSR